MKILFSLSNDCYKATVGQSTFYSPLWEDQIIVFDRKIEAATTRFPPPPTSKWKHMYILIELIEFYIYIVLGDLVHTHCKM